jgi:hypothetical protein
MHPMCVRLFPGPDADGQLADEHDRHRRAPTARCGRAARAAPLPPLTQSARTALRGGGLSPAAAAPLR